MRGGRVEQAGPPEAVYAQPRSRWSAEFLGAADVVPGVAADGSVTCELGSFPASPELAGPVEVVVRPEAVAIARPDDGGVPARVVGRSFYGHDQLVRLELASGLVVQSRVGGTAGWRPGDEVHLQVAGPVSILPDPTPA
jgi:iron(III) transport system ATP-binding protein